MPYEFLKEKLMAIGKISRMFDGVPSDELKDIEIVEDLQLFEYDLKVHDFSLWEALPWLSSHSYKYVIFGIIYASYSQKVTEALCIDAIIEELSGVSQKSNDVNLWPDPFCQHWASLSSDESIIVKDWLAYLIKNSLDSDVKTTASTAIEIVERLSNGQIGISILL